MRCVDCGAGVLPSVRSGIKGFKCKCLFLCEESMGEWLPSRWEQTMRCDDCGADSGVSVRCTTCRQNMVQQMNAATHSWGFAQGAPSGLGPEPTECPRCRKPLTYQGLNKTVPPVWSGDGACKVTDCPHCGMRVLWSPMFSTSLADKLMAESLKLGTKAVEIAVSDASLFDKLMAEAQTKPLPVPPMPNWGELVLQYGMIHGQPLTDKQRNVIANGMAELRVDWANQLADVRFLSDEHAGSEIHGWPHPNHYRCPFCPPGEKKK